MRSLFTAIIVCFSLTSFAQGAVDYAELEDQLAGKGLGGWIHGSVKSQSLFVFTWRSSSDFFVHDQFPMIAASPKVQKQIDKFGRHDYVVLKGKFIENKAPIRHLLITEVLQYKPWNGPGSNANYKYEVKIPDDLLSKTEAIGKVHISAEGGKVLVFEYKDVILPVFNSKPALAKDLFRNDKIKLHFVLRTSPSRPLHLEVDVKHKNPIEVLENIEDGHGKPITIEGPLVMFPQSPQIKFDVYAVADEDADGVRRNYTLINFTDMKLFTAIRKKLDKVWNKQKSTAKYDRNKFINRNIIIRVKGTKNVVHEKQANPQVLIDKLIDVEVLTK